MTDHSRTPKPALDAMTVLVAAVIVHDRAAGRVVLLQRGPRAVFGQGLWDLPMGKSEPGEPITETAVRELYEETGLTVEPETLELVHVVHGSLGVAAPNGYVTVVFATADWTGEPENREPTKHAQVTWVDVDELPLAPGEFVRTSAGALRRYLDGGPLISLAGWG
ncbi:NUDIX domain-containing protein [Streptomyces sp. WI04-05B]|uniref:NUDIX domain-containing protein n=1 Tax=Streptomyces TaxID=1883 RepID=UPI00299FE054|nr:MULTISPECIES: NUDIX domain-containing protein [unclassified Streptomyces]MDX2542438.1 NUDIX domain-containing protein [Streptomyces sp. WI04-05B]MDX2582543.1 NUDIX domain-containing protein [Streptomyces sp. WI04-05A]MDX3747955.1 NUDIX domain-containing protein [Streptomyces sp. AK08-02]